MKLTNWMARLFSRITSGEPAAATKRVSFKMTFLVGDNSIANAFQQDLLGWPDTFPDVTLELRKLRTPGQPEQVIFCAKKTCPVQHHIYEALTNLANAKLPPGSDIEIAKNAVDAQGQVKPNCAAPIDALPEFFRRFCNEIHDELYESARNWANLLRWRLGLTEGQPNAIFFKSLEFTIDDQSFHQLAQFITLEIRFGIPRKNLDVTAELISSVAELRNQSESEPVSRAMFREAWNLHQVNPRSALMIGYAAIETGCKDFIGRLVPDAKWLVMEAPTPPLPGILKNYLPTLPVRAKVGGQVIIPAGIRKAVREAMEARNTLAHSGTLKLSQDQLEGILRCFSDLLWLLDVYAGFEWAAQHLTHETANALFASASVKAS